MSNYRSSGTVRVAKLPDSHGDRPSIVPFPGSVGYFQHLTVRFHFAFARDPEGPDRLSHYCLVTESVRGSQYLSWVDRLNNRRLLEPIDNIPPAEFEMAYYRQLEESADAA